MNYTISLLTTKPDCQSVMNIVQAEKNNLVFKKEALERKRLAVDLTSQDIEANLVHVNDELQSLQLYYDALPEGEDKKETFVKITKLQYKKFLLDQRKVNFGVIDLLDKEFDISRMEREVSEADDFIRLLTDRMNEIH